MDKYFSNFINILLKDYTFTSFDVNSIVGQKIIEIYAIGQTGILQSGVLFLNCEMNSWFKSITCNIQIVKKTRL